MELPSDRVVSEAGGDAERQLAQAERCDGF